MKKIRGGTRSQLQGRVLPGVPSFDKWKRSEGELAHSCEGRCSPSGSPLLATLKNKKARFVRDVFGYVEWASKYLLSKGW